ncbi:MAG: hypothetical protein IJT71_01030 [Oscillospiraceae bacterium]|nr:hypothetical protein [Oscillospiraceae bacterium]
MAANKTDGAAEKPKRTRKAKAPEMTQDDLIREYLEVYHRCMIEDPKSFDAKDALNALDQISKMLGLDAPIRSADVDGNRVILTLGDGVGDRGD